MVEDALITRDNESFWAMANGIREGGSLTTFQKYFVYRYYEYGRLISRVHIPNDAIWEFDQYTLNIIYPNGSIAYFIFGLLDGPQCIFDNEDGELIFYQEYTKGEPDGKSYVISKRSQYFVKSIWKEGKLDGLQTKTKFTGEVKETIYEMGYKVWARSYYCDGQVRKEKDYDTFSCRTFYPCGKLKKHVLENGKIYRF